MKEILIEQFKAGYAENGWFVALKNALEGVTAEQAVWRAEGFEHSVWDAVYHLTFWNGRWLKRYRDEPLEPGSIVIAETFQAPEDPGEDDWREMLGRFYGVMDALRNVLEDISEEKLNELVSEKYGEPWSVPFAHINIHNAYHTGQIVVIRKLQGSWNPEQGVS
jgi:uncharacterized damage-inducible protein DinB